MNHALEVNDLTVSYHSKPVLWNVSLYVPNGVLCGIVGPNGAGKSTLIKAVMGLVSKNSGEINLLGMPLDKVRNRISYVPQRESVDWDFPASVFDVALMGRYGHLSLFNRLGKEDKKIALDALSLVGMEAYKDRQISQLSGGQQQRVFLARALAQQADLYFMDEPFAGVDAATESSIVSVLQNLISQGKTVVVVHHDLNSINKYFDWLLLLDTRVVAFGKTEEVFTQENLRQTYGSRLTVLSEVSHRLDQEKFPVRE
jgi:manganese/zinc/iron transport system ATP- binding protein